MKLIDLMVKDGVKWPGWAVSACQDAVDNKLKFAGHGHGNIEFYSGSGKWRIGSLSWGLGHDCSDFKVLSKLSDDHATSIITKDEYENALKPKPLTREELIERVKKDGWPVSPDYVSEYNGWVFESQGMSDVRFKRIDSSFGCDSDYVYFGDIYDRNGIPLSSGYQKVSEGITDRMGLLLSGRGVKQGATPHNHYFKDVSGIDTIDVYRVLDLFDVTQPAIQHAVKKLLCGGKRGAKDEIKDYQEAIDSIARAIEMAKEDEVASS